MLAQSPEALKLTEEIADLKAQIKLLDPVCHPSTLGGVACSTPVRNDDDQDGTLTSFVFSGWVVLQRRSRIS